MLAFKSVTELSAAIATGELKPSDLVEELLGRIGRFDQKLHAFVTVYADEARAAAKAAAEAALAMA